MARALIKKNKEDELARLPSSTESMTKTVNDVILEHISPRIQAAADTNAHSITINAPFPIPDGIKDNLSFQTAITEILVEKLKGAGYDVRLDVVYLENNVLKVNVVIQW